MKGGDKQCHYRDVVLAGVVVRVMDKTKWRYKERVFEVVKQEFESEAQLLKWLVEMGVI